MYRVKILVLLLLSATNLMSQVRLGWRSIYDTSGRLTRMNYYENGQNIADSNYFFQYYTDNVVKGIVRGKITREQGCTNGSVMLFDESENLASYNVTRNGQIVFSSACQDLVNCSATWGDLFDVSTNCWEADSFLIENGELVLFNNKSLAVATFNPPVPIDMNNDFIIQTNIPKTTNSSRIGVVLGWKDPSNFVLFEILSGDYFSVVCFEDGILKQMGEPRIPIGKKAESANSIKITRNKSDLIFEVNQNIEMVIPAPNFVGEKIGLINRSRGKARFHDFYFQYLSPENNPIISTTWIGKGTGFFITTSGKILTTYDAIANAKSLRVKGVRNGEFFTMPARILRTEEEHNLAVLELTDNSFIHFSELPYGYTNSKPISESAIYAIGFPNAVSGIVVNPEVFPGKILPSAVSSSTNMLLELSFRYGMIGSPIFDSDANFIGIVSNKGTELKYTEVIDFYSKSRLILGNMGRYERTLESPYKRAAQKDKIKALSEMVVIIESSIFDINGENTNNEESEY
jgi:hypothetical protein